MTAGVYAIVNTATGRVYVGSSRNIESRWSGRRGALNKGQGSNRALQADWSVSQGAGFEFRVLEVTSDDNDVLLTAERRWMQTLREEPPGLYNLRDASIGRDGFPRYYRGWGWVPKRRKAHYFIKNRHAICGTAQLKWWVDLEDFNHDSSSNCAACRKLYATLPKRRAGTSSRGEGDGRAE